MKFLIVLALAVAVSSAAFTGSLIQQTQPLLDQIKADLIIPARSSVEVGFQSQFANAIQEQITNVLSQIQGHVSTVQIATAAVASQIQAAVAQLQALANGNGLAEGLIGNVQATISNLLNTLSTGSNRDSIQVPAQVSFLIQAIIDQPVVQGMISSSSLIQCLKQQVAAEGEVLDYAHIQALNVAGNLNADYLLASPAVQLCMNQAGGAANVITTSPIITQIQAAVASLNLQTVVHNVLNQLLGEELGGQLIALLAQNHANRGLFNNVWDGITGAAGNIWDGVSGAAINVWDGAAGAAVNTWSFVSEVTTGVAGQIAGVASSAWNSAAEKLEMIRQIAAAFLAGGVSAAQDLGQAAAQQLLDAIAPYYQDLGLLGTNIVTELLSIYTGLNIPPLLLGAIMG